MGQPTDHDPNTTVRARVTQHPPDRRLSSAVATEQPEVAGPSAGSPRPSPEQIPSRPGFHCHTPSRAQLSSTARVLPQATAFGLESQRLARPAVIGLFLLLRPCQLRPCAGSLCPAGSFHNRPCFPPLPQAAAASGPSSCWLPPPRPCLFQPPSTSERALCSSVLLWVRRGRGKKDTS